MTPGGGESCPGSSDSGEDGDPRSRGDLLRERWCVWYASRSVLIGEHGVESSLTIDWADMSASSLRLGESDLSPTMDAMLKLLIFDFVGGTTVDGVIAIIICRV
jgi:hypothetical protein